MVQKADYCLRKVVILVEDDRSVALIGRENKDVGAAAEGA